MTWTKLGEEFGDAARKLSDAAFRTHVEALMWSNRRLLDLLIDPDDIRRFAETKHPEEAIAELVDAGWWRDEGEGWFIGCKFDDWQLEKTVVEVRREQSALRQRRHRMHAAGDHSICTDRCSVTRDASRDASRDKKRDGTRDPVRNGSERNGAEWEVQYPVNQSNDQPTDEERWAEVREAWGPDSAA